MVKITNVRNGRGFTLIEMVIALAVTSLVLIGALAAFRAQQATYYGLGKTRAAQNSAWNAMLYLEQVVPTAGAGLDSTLAFDMSGYTTKASCPAQMANCPLDSTTNTDELIFLTRNPMYWVNPSSIGDGRGKTWNVTNLTANTLTLTAREGDQFLQGQILQLVCQSIMLYGYVTVATTVPAVKIAPSGNPNAPAESTVNIPLVAGNANTPNPFQTQLLATDPCFTSAAGPARVFQIDRYRLHVMPVALANGQYEPYLMLDMGIDENGDGVINQNDEMVLADGVEDFQVGYSFVNSALGVAGTTPGAAITFGAVANPGAAGQNANTVNTLQLPGPANVPAGQTAWTATSLLSYAVIPPLPAARLSAHQGNIASVRIALVGRSPTPAQDGSSTFPIQNYKLMNFVGAPAWIQNTATARGGDDGYQRNELDTSIPVPNLLTQLVTPF